MLTDRKTREVMGVTVFAGADWPMEPLVIVDIFKKCDSSDGWVECVYLIECTIQTDCQFK